ncbi:hypothetical protein DXD15_02760 [Blautia sp. TF11-31AT]|nr:hypothetical protein DXD15_02760 [Blautia sp. TF11-31AT]
MNTIISKSILVSQNTTKALERLFRKKGYHRFRNSRPLTFLDAAVVSEAFLHHEQRKVDKGACISFRGKCYETKPSLIGHTVEISYDPVAPEQITISYQGMESFTAAALKIGSYCDKRPTLPASMQEQTPTTPPLS